MREIFVDAVTEILKPEGIKLDGIFEQQRESPFGCRGELSA